MRLFVMKNLTSTKSVNVFDGQRAAARSTQQEDMTPSSDELRADRGQRLRGARRGHRDDDVEGRRDLSFQRCSGGEGQKKWCEKTGPSRTCFSLSHTLLDRSTAGASNLRQIWWERRWICFAEMIVRCRARQVLRQRCKKTPHTWQHLVDFGCGKATRCRVPRRQVFGSGPP